MTERTRLGALDHGRACKPDLSVSQPGYGAKAVDSTGTQDQVVIQNEGLNTSKNAYEPEDSYRTGEPILCALRGQVRLGLMHCIMIR